MKIGKFLLSALFHLYIFCFLILLFLGLYLPRASYGFHVEAASASGRLIFVDAAIAHLGASEGTEAHKAIIDTYNSQDLLPQGYEVQYDDDWCATFVSVVAMEAGLTDIIPTECGCERQIGLWQALGRWEETDYYLPLPGDIIYYDWDVRTPGDSTGWSDHVGIVVGTHGPFLKVIEGNKDDTVDYRYVIRWDPRIRGYGLPEFE